MFSPESEQSDPKGHHQSSFKQAVLGAGTQGLALGGCQSHSALLSQKCSGTPDIQGQDEERMKLSSLKGGGSGLMG